MSEYESDTSVVAIAAPAIPSANGRHFSGAFVHSLEVMANELRTGAETIGSQVDDIVTAVDSARWHGYRAHQARSLAEGPVRDAVTKLQERFHSVADALDGHAREQRDASRAPT